MHIHDKRHVKMIVRRKDCTRKKSVLNCSQTKTHGFAAIRKFIGFRLGTSVQAVISKTAVCSFFFFFSPRSVSRRDRRETHTG